VLFGACFFILGLVLTDTDKVINYEPMSLWRLWLSVVVHLDKLQHLHRSTSGMTTINKAIGEFCKRLNARISAGGGQNIDITFVPKYFDSATALN